MSSRNVKDSAGRVWACREDDAAQRSAQEKQGRDVSILCTTASVIVPVRITVGWQWTTMADNGLARLIADASPVPKRPM